MGILGLGVLNIVLLLLYYILCFIIKPQTKTTDHSITLRNMLLALFLIFLEITILSPLYSISL